MPVYQGQKLDRFKEKQGGKNKSTIDGFYKTQDDIKFFIKKPSDSRELFTELFAGLLLKEFIERELIDKRYFPSLICADVIQFEDKSYGLIQPLVSFDELHKIIGTSNSKGNDRNVWAESLWGPQYYTGITRQDNYFGLSMALMFSLLLGAHSVHSGNIVVLKNDDLGKNKQFARIDWGDAFRNFAHKKNNENILYAYENQGINYKKFTKNYFLNYKNINGLFPAMAIKGAELQQKLNSELLTEIVKSALQKIPADLINAKTQQELADYMCISSLKDTTFGEQGKCDLFAAEMAKQLEVRFQKIAQLQDVSPSSSEDNQYESFIEVTPLVLETEPSQSFVETIDQWSTLLQEKHIEYNPLAGDLLNLPDVVTQLNRYVDKLALECEANNIWENQKAPGKNIFTEYDKSQGGVIHGHAFVPYYKESVVLRRLFAVEPATFNLSRFAAFEKPTDCYIKEHQNSVWAKAQTLLTGGNNIINTLKVMKQAQAFGMDEAVRESIKLLKTQLHGFKEAEAELQKTVEPSSKKSQDKPESSFFYPIGHKDLADMTGEQLATICFEELNDSKPSPLIERILRHDTLWQSIDDALNSEAFKGRTDNIAEKIAKIREWRQLLHISSQKTASQIAQLQSEVKGLKSLGQEKEQLQQQSDEQQKELEQLKSQIKADAQKITQLQGVAEELKSVKQENERLQQQSDEQLIKIGQLEPEIKEAEQKNEQLQGEVEELKSVKQENERLQQQSDEQLIRIGQLESEVKKTEQKNEQLQGEAEDLQSLGEENKQLQQQSDEQLIKIGQLEPKIKEAEQKNEQLQGEVEELKSVKQENERLQQQSDEQLIKIGQLEPKIKDAEQKINQLQGVAKDLKSAGQEKEQLQQKKIAELELQSADAEQQYQKALKQGKISTARMLRIAPVIYHINIIENKAQKLKDRNATEAYEAANTLAGNLRQAIDDYCQNDTDEKQALETLKEKANGHITTAKDVLNEPRQEWKYILANVGMAFLLLGVGYLPAVLIHKQVTGHYTFFSTTDSGKKLQDLEHTVSTISLDT